jgi:hypothetical protein
VLLDKVTGSVWYVPGGQSTIGQMIQDAGGDYPWAKDEHSGSVSLPSRLSWKAGEADVWLFRYSSDHDITYAELSRRTSRLRPVQCLSVRRMSMAAMSSVPHSTKSHPSVPTWLLNDFIRILHPEIEGLEPLRYYKRL